MPPLNLLIKPVSSLCNLQCKYCFYADVSQHRQTVSYGPMREETLESLVKRAFAYADGFVSFAFQGGEPTLAGLDFYQRLIELQSRYNQKRIIVNNILQTNGYQLSEAWAEFLSEHHFLVGLSLDGTRESHNSLRVDRLQKGTYDAVVKTADLLEKYHVPFNVLCVVNNFVARHPQKVYDNLKKYKFIQFIPCLDSFDSGKTNYSLTNERYANFLDITFDAYYRDFMNGSFISVRNYDNYINMLMGRLPENCAMNGQCTCNFVIEGDGSVFPCDFYVLDEWKLGNIMSDSFEALQNSALANLFVDISKYKDKACQNCKYFFLCRGGCRRDREPLIGKRPSLNRLCKSYQVFFEHNIHRMMQMAQRIKMAPPPGQ